MTGIIVVFPNKDNATNIRNLLARGGMVPPVHRLYTMQIPWITGSWSAVTA